MPWRMISLSSPKLEVIYDHYRNDTGFRYRLSRGNVDGKLRVQGRYPGSGRGIPEQREQTDGADQGSGSEGSTLGSQPAKELQKKAEKDTEYISRKTREGLIVNDAIAEERNGYKKEIATLKEEIALMKSRFDRPRCERCGKIVAKKDYKEGKCKKCFKASVEAIQKIETQVAEPEYLTTEQAGEILKAGGEVILMHSDGVDGCVYYMRPDGHVGCVNKSDNMRTGAYCSSVEEFVKGWGDQRWAIFKAPPVCKKCGKKTEPGADLCDKCPLVS